MMEVVRFNKSNQPVWDAFVDASKNGTFMLKRGYVEYHADRFEDASLMFYEGDRLVAVLPASRHGNEVRSHGGLTYGGLIVDRNMTASLMLEVFEALKRHLADNGVKTLIYKRVPTIYYSYPADEDIYALFRNGAELFRRDISTVIDLADPIPFSSIRKRCIKKGVKAGLVVRQTEDFESYVSLLTEVLEMHHQTRPPHSAAELRLLASRFPECIKLFCAYRNDQMTAGVLVFEAHQVVHAQYIANSEEGREIGALDLVMDYLINAYSKGHRYFDFGISTEDEGHLLNEGLVSQKEMFGGRGVTYDHYRLPIRRGEE